MNRKYGAQFGRTLFIALAIPFNLICAMPQPFVYWTMDRYSGTRLIPENNTDTRFQGDFSPLGDVNQVLREGVVGNALYVSEEDFHLIDGIRNDCIRDLDECAAGGLSLVFWLNILQWNGRSFQIIFRSTTATKSLAGVYFAKGTGETLEVYMRGGGGQTYECEFSASYVWNTWSLIGLAWDSLDSSISVYVNGTKLNIPTSVNSANSRSPTSTNFVVGSALAPSFFLDEFRIYYETISADDMLYIFSSGTGSLSPTTVSDAQSTTPNTTPAATTNKNATSTGLVTSSTSATSNSASTEASTSTTEATTSVSTSSATTTSVKATTSLATSTTASSTTVSTTTSTVTSKAATTPTTTTAVSTTTTTVTSKAATAPTAATSVSTTTTTVTSKATTPKPTTSTETTATTTIPTSTTPVITIEQATTPGTSIVPTSTTAPGSRTSSTMSTIRSTTSTPEEETPFWRRTTFLAIVIPAAVVIVFLLFIMICLCNKKRRGRQA